MEVRAAMSAVADPMQKVFASTEWRAATGAEQVECLRCRILVRIDKPSVNVGYLIEIQNCVLNHMSASRIVLPNLDD